MSPLNPFSRPALRSFEERLSHFQIQIHRPKAMADLLPDGFIWTPFCPDPDQAIFEPKYTFPKRWQICFRMALFGHLSVHIWIKSFSSPDTPSQSYGRFASKRLHLDTFLVWSDCNIPLHKCCCGSSLVDIFGSPFVPIWLFSINVTRNNTDTHT